MLTENHLMFDQFSLKYSESEFLYQDFSLSIPTNQWLGILGPSGVGKTTLLHAIAKHFRTIHPRMKISLLPQKTTLLPWLSVLDNVLLGEYLRGSIENSSYIEARDLLIKVGLNHLALQKPKQLSGGQCQRVIIARTMHEDSDIVLMDEPFASLDAITKQEIQECALQHFKHKTVILVTHDPLEALRLCDQIIVLQNKPVRYDTMLQLNSAKPRNLDHPEVMQHYQTLMDQLVTAKQHIKVNA